MKKNNKTKKVLIGILMVILAVVAIGAGYFATIFAKLENVDLDKDKLGTSDNFNNKSIKNIALFGIDSAEMKGRSDAIMILTLDDEHKKIKLTSIMRDSYVNIDGHGMDKINHAYSYGGPELAIKTLNDNFGLNIQDFVAVNFESLKEIVDELGGVNINITEEELPHISGLKRGGVNKLTGGQALSYSRIRYASGDDYMRTQRQRNILMSLYESFQYTSLTEYPKVISSILPHVKTNLVAKDLISLGGKFYNELNKNLIEERFPRDGQEKGIEKNGVFYLQYDLEKAKKEMQEYIFNDNKVWEESK